MLICVVMQSEHPCLYIIYYLTSLCLSVCVSVCLIVCVSVQKLCVSPLPLPLHVFNNTISNDDMCISPTPHPPPQCVVCLIKLLL